MELPLTPSRDSVGSPELAILSNSPALHALKRQQLVQLAKQYGLKASGKNVELIERLKQHGKDLVLVQQQDQSNTSWALVSPSGVPTPADLVEFGINQNPSSTRGIATSNSNSSLASTIRSAGTAVFRKFGGGGGTVTTATTSIYPSLQDAFERYGSTSPEKVPEEEKGTEEEDPERTMEFDHSLEGAIRRVTTHTTVNTTFDGSILGAREEEEEVPPVPTIPDQSTFIFGSPPSKPTPFNFSMTMPGSLLSLSTTSWIGAGEEHSISTPETTQLSILEEMNRRASEARAEAEKLGVKLARSDSTYGRYGGAGGNRSPEKSRTEEVFDGKHKRVFDNMDSITNHYAAKRPHLETSTSNLSKLVKSSSSRTLNASTSTSDRPVKRVKPSNSSANLVSALRDSGWTSAPRQQEKVSLKDSIRGHTAGITTGGAAESLLKGKGKMREDLKSAREIERDERKRRLELAKARRKSQASPGAGLLRKGRRPSMSVGPKHSGSLSSSTSSFLKSTFKRFTSSVNAPVAAPSPALAAVQSPPISQTPRFAIPTASSSSRAGLVASSSTRTLSSIKSPVVTAKKGEPGRKKFDLQESLRRPMSWKPRLAGSASLSSKPSTLSRSSSSSLIQPPLSRQVSARVANPSLLTATTKTPSAPPVQRDASVLETEQSVTLKLASLPSAPTTPFTNSSNVPSLKSKGSTTGGRKLVSTGTKKARSGKQTVEGLETKARKIRAVRNGGSEK
ncbi:hypothetical protein JCM16303_006661 [Sporobolomyces ruberrimus]